MNAQTFVITIQDNDLFKTIEEILPIVINGFYLYSNEDGIGICKKSSPFEITEIFDLEGHEFKCFISKNTIMSNKTDYYYGIRNNEKYTNIIDARIILQKIWNYIYDISWVYNYFQFEMLLKKKSILWDYLLLDLEIGLPYKALFKKSKNGDHVKVPKNVLQEMFS